MQFVASEASTLRYVGLGYGGAGTAPGNITFALRLQNGVAEVRENNAYRSEIGFAAGDTFSIAVENNAIRYFKNGGIFYTSTVAATSALRLHAVLFNLNASVGGIGIGGTGTAAVAPAPTSPTAPRLPRWARPRAAGSAPVKRR